jgi:hypothetical protein
MCRFALPALLLAVELPGCARPPPVALAQAARQPQPSAALVAFDAIAARRDLSEAEQVQALVGAAHACDRLGNADGARRRLERAVAHEVPGVIEPVEFELAERLRDRDRARALNLYYRAAAGAEKHRAGGFPYRAAMERILQLSQDR